MGIVCRVVMMFIPLLLLTVGNALSGNEEDDRRMGFFSIGEGELVFDQEGATMHEISIFVFPPLSPVRWDSPASLLRSIHWGYIRDVFRKNSYMIGHVAVGISTPILDQPLITGMRAADPSESAMLVLDDGIGMAIMGAPLKGTLETREELLAMINAYIKREKLGIITIRVNSESMQRMLSFYNGFAKGTGDGHVPAEHYGGAFWPRYYGEGSGCTAFCMALLEAGNVLLADSDSWITKRNICMNLMGGEYNKNQKVPPFRIIRSKEWHSGDGRQNEDFVTISKYDPAKIYRWISDIHGSELPGVRFREEEGVKTIYIDKSAIVVDNEEPLFFERPNEDIFIDYFLNFVLRNAG